MKRVSVDSSNVKSLGWENGTLEVEYHSGGIYHYTGVPASKHAALMTENSRPGGSVGGYIHQNIKPHHGFKKISG